MDLIRPDDYIAYTFASVGLALIGDYVWEDLDRDGIQESNEPPLANVLVELYDENKEYLKSTTSDFSGRYFLEGIEPGRYYVKFNSPSGFLPTLAGQGELNQNSDVTFSGFTPVIDLDINQIEFSIDGGFYTNGSIGNSVWIDDGDGRLVGGWTTRKSERGTNQQETEQTRSTAENRHSSLPSYGGRRPPNPSRRQCDGHAPTDQRIVKYSCQCG